MSIAIFGAGGLLGSHFCALHPEVIPITRDECDITDVFAVDRALEVYKPKVVVNCAGVVPKARDSAYNLFSINVLGPQILRKACDMHSAHLIHISTDCVFKGNVGDRFSEISSPNPETDYGLSKMMGEREVTEAFPYSSHSVIRASFIGWPDPKKRGFIAWAFTEQGEIKGWRNSFWNGLTTVELVKQIMDFINSKLYYKYPLYHLFNNISTTKHDLLVELFGVYSKPVQVTPVLRPKLSRMLSSIYHKGVNKTYKQLLEEMREKEHLLL